MLRALEEMVAGILYLILLYRVVTWIVAGPAAGIYRWTRDLVRILTVAWRPVHLEEKAGPDGNDMDREA